MELLKLNDAAKRAPADERIPGLLDDGLVLCVAPEGSGKTFLGIHMGVHIASGTRWQGKPVEQGAVIYCIAEGVSFFPYRVTTALDAIGAPVDDLPFYLFDESLNLRTDEKGKISKDVETLCDSVAAMEGTTGERTKLIVFDTLNRFMPGGDENNQAECGGLVNGCEYLRKQLGCTVMLMHHMRKDGKAVRGNTVLTGAADQILVCTPEDEIVDAPVLWSTKGIGKRKDRDPIEQWFRFKKVAMSRGYMYLPKEERELMDLDDLYVFHQEERVADELTGETEWVDTTVQETLVMEPCAASTEDSVRVTAKDESLLAAISKKGAMGISEIMRSMDMAQKTAYHAVGRLIKAGKIVQSSETKKYSAVKDDYNPFEEA